jgi:glyoxylase-like metal-dependent hydrolase (beta-lactamase superfamily II)
VSYVPGHATDWAAPGAYEAAPGIFRLPLPLPNDGLVAINVYAIEAREGLVLIDSGAAREESRSVLEQSLRQIGRGLEDVSRILVTHAHYDHYTQAVAIRRDVGAHVSLGVGERSTLEVIQRADASAGEVQIAQLRTAAAEPVIRRLEEERVLARKVDVSEWETPDSWLVPGFTVQIDDRELLTMSTPGHTRGHVVFADFANEVVLAGDHVLPHITPSIGFERLAGDYPLSDFLNSLAVMHHLPDLTLLPGHGPSGGSLHARVDELLEHHAARLQASVDSIAAGAETAFEVAQELRWTNRDRRFVELDGFNQMLATTETLAHLNLLTAQNQLVRSQIGEAYRFVLPARVPSASYH